MAHTSIQLSEINYSYQKLSVLIDQPFSTGRMHNFSHQPLVLLMLFWHLKCSWSAKKEKVKKKNGWTKMANYPLLVGRHFPSPIIMGHFGESSYANLLFTNSTILTTITAIFACCNAVRIVQWPVYTLLFQVILQIVIKKIILWPLEWQHKFDDFGFCVFFYPKMHKNYDNISLNFQQKKYIYIYI